MAKIPSKDNRQGYKFDIEVTPKNNSYVAYAKEGYPPGLPNQINKQTITWLCNFGVKPGEGGRDVNTAYTVRLQLPDVDIPGLSNDTIRHICIYHPSIKENNGVRVVGEGTRGKMISFDLDYGDPPVGIYP